jgi:hypothetical protein
VVEDEVGHEVERAVEEREQADHPPEQDERVPPGQPAQRRDRHRHDDEAQRPDAGVVGDGLDRVDAQVAPERVVDTRRATPARARQEDGGLGDAADEVCVWRHPYQ